MINIEGGHAEVKKRVKYYDKNNYFFESVERSWRGQLKCFQNKLKSNKKEAGSLFPDSPLSPYIIRSYGNILRCFSTTCSENQF